MRDDELKNILRGAESDLAPTTLNAVEIAGRVRSLHQTQQRRRRFAVAASLPVAAALAFTAWNVTPHSNLTTNAPATPHVAEITADDIDRLIAEAEAHERKARALIAARPQQTIALADDPLADIREELDVVAYGMIQRADQLREAMRPDGEVIELYRDVVRQFPATYSARVAQQRLRDLSANSEGSTS
jgi:hypothetical protein